LPELEPCEINELGSKPYSNADSGEEKSSNQSHDKS
jgi:hypothetical protein